ncbi:MAG: VCBS repeat-containing protein [Pyrinomonadaceae bacterium]
MKRFLIVVFIILLAAEFITAIGQCRGAIEFQTSRLGVFPQSHSYRHQIDFNGDGIMDFAGNTDASAQPSNNIGILINSGTGAVQHKLLTVNNGAFGGFFGGRWGDFNADGRPDFLGYFSNAPQKVIFYNDGNGGLSFGTPLEFATPSEYISTFGDINNDLRPDFITTGAPSAGSDEPNFYLYLSTGDGTYDAPRLVATTHGGLFFGDFNGDGRKDIVIRKDISNSQNYSLKILLQTATGGFDEQPETAVGRFRAEGVGEFNHDGIDDLYGTTSFSTNIAVYRSRTGATHQLSEFPAAYKNGSYRLYFGDFNGDEKQDILDSGRGSDATFGYSALFGMGNGGFRVMSNPTPLNDQSINSVGQVVDFNGDGLDDIIRTTSDLSNQTTVDLLTATCRPFGQSKAVDFDGDGKTDLALWDAASGNWSHRPSSQNNASVTVNWGGAAFGDVPVVGDFDGDGKSDHAVYRDPTGDWYILRSSDGAVVIRHFGLAGDRPAAADFDGDGITDIAVFRPSEGNWYMIESRTDSVLGLHFGATGDIPVQSDFDGDGKADVAVYRPSEGNWYYLRSTNGQFAALHWGVATDVPVPADFDGDGRSDLAVYRPSEGNWYILRSFDSAFSVVRWGIAEDIPAAFDTDGDGIFEPGVFRPSTRVWYVNSGLITGFGEPGQMPVLIN